MDSMLKTLTEVRRAMGFKGTNGELLISEELIYFCVENQIILKSVKSKDMDSVLYEEKYYPFLLNSAWKQLASLKHLDDADQLRSEPGYQKVAKVLWDHGVFGDLRERFKKYREDENASIKVKQQPKITLAEVHLNCQIYHGYTGSYSAFMKHIQRTYGSFAEYCLQKGYDINTTKWGDKDTALRVARKIGSEVEIKHQSPSLYKFLIENGLLENLFNDEKSA
jgi:hypothetical protein